MVLFVAVATRGFLELQHIYLVFVKYKVNKAGGRLVWYLLIQLSNKSPNTVIKFIIITLGTDDTSSGHLYFTK